MASGKPSLYGQKHDVTKTAERCGASLARVELLILDDGFHP